MVINFLTSRQYVVYWTLLLFSIQTQANLGKWEYYTSLATPTSLQAFEDKLFIGTEGGIRAWEPNTQQETIYNGPSHGLMDIYIQGFAIVENSESVPSSLWAISREGIFHQFESNKWQPYDRGLDKRDYSISPGAVLGIGKYVIVGTNKGLSFFNTETRLVELNITSLTTFKELSVTSLLQRDSVLYVGTPQGAFQSAFYWDNLLEPPSTFSDEHLSVYNPSRWQNVAITLPADTVNGDSSIVFMTWNNDTLTGYPKGQEILDDNGQRIGLATVGLPVVNGQSTYNSIIDQSLIQSLGGQTYVGNSNHIYRIEQDTLTLIPNSSSTPSGQIVEVKSGEFGTYAWYANRSYINSNIYELKDNTWFLLPGSDIPQTTELLSPPHKGFEVLDKHHFLMGTWGFGLRAYKDSVQTIFSYPQVPCFSGIEGGTSHPLDFSIIAGVTRLNSNTLIAVSRRAFLPYRLALIHQSTDGSISEVQCLEESLTPQPSGYTEESFYVYNSRYVLIAANSGLHVYDFLDVDNPVFLKTYPIPNQATNFLSAIVDKHERLWVTLDQGIYYKDRFLSSSDSSMIEVTNVIANSCNYTDQDSSGTLWFGCDNGLLQIETENQQAVYTSRLYKRSDGLLDDQVSYLYVDRTSGTLWVAGEKGLVKVQYLAQPPLQNPNTSYAYPIPAYNIHPTITFTNLPKDSEIYIYNQGRYLVYHAKRGSVQGGQFLWDKKNKQGQRVRGGVYYYAIRTPSDVKRGKLILAH